MAAIDFVFGHVIDHHAFAGLANFMANRGFDLQLPAWLETEVDLIEHGTGDPT
jgi:hypothetical protein